jgi:uncharacterized protein (TIGR00369 family)
VTDAVAGSPGATLAQLQEILSASAFVAPYGFRVHAIALGSCTLFVPFSPELERPGGIVGGQVFMAAADVAMWLAIKTVRGPDDDSVTSQMQTQFLRSARREEFLCTATVVRLGRRNVFGTAECVAADGRLLTFHTISYAVPGGSSPD